MTVKKGIILDNTSIHIHTGKNVQQTIPYKTLQDSTGPHMTNHSRPFRTIQDHTYPYKTTKNHTRPQKVI